MAIIRILTLALSATILFSSSASAQMFKDGPFRRMFTKPSPEEADSAKKTAAQPSREPTKLPEYPRPPQRNSNSLAQRNSSPPASNRNEPATPATQFQSRSNLGLRVPTPAPLKPIAPPPSFARPNSRSDRDENRTALPARPLNDQLRMFGAVVQQLNQSGPITVIAAPELSDAYRSGLRRGDELVSVGGIELEDLVAIEGVEGLFKPGDRVNVVVNRNRKEQKLELVYRPDDAQSMPPDQPESALTISENDEATQSEPNQLHIAPRHQIRSLLGFSPAQDKNSAGAQSAQDDSPVANQLLLDSIEQLRTLVREQEAEIERLQNELRKTRSSSMPVRRR